jgi:hypothetical protein
MQRTEIFIAMFLCLSEAVMRKMIMLAVAGYLWKKVQNRYSGKQQVGKRRAV